MKPWTPCLLAMALFVLSGCSTKQSGGQVQEIEEAPVPVAEGVRDDPVADLPCELSSPQPTAGGEDLLWDQASLQEALGVYEEWRLRSLAEAHPESLQHSGPAVGRQEVGARIVCRIADAQRFESAFLNGDGRLIEDRIRLQVHNLQRVEMA